MGKMKFLVTGILLFVFIGHVFATSISDKYAIRQKRNATSKSDLRDGSSKQMRNASTSLVPKKCSSGQENSCSIDCIPREVMEIIMGHLPTQDLGNCAMVCRKLNETFYGNSLLTKKFWQRIASTIVGYDFSNRDPMTIKDYRALCVHGSRSPDSIYGVNAWERHFKKNRTAGGWESHVYYRRLSRDPSTRTACLRIDELVPRNETHVIDLIEMGYPSFVLDQFQPLIEIKATFWLYYAPSCQNDVRIALLNNRGQIHRNYDRRLSLPLVGTNVSRIDDGEDKGEYRETNFENYGPGVRKIRLIHNNLCAQFHQAAWIMPESTNDVIARTWTQGPCPSLIHELHPACQCSTREHY